MVGLRRTFGEMSTAALNSALPRPSQRNKTTPAIALLPLALLVGSSMTALAYRLRAANPLPPGLISKETAMATSAESCALMTGESVQVLESHSTSAYAKSAHCPVYEWETICRTETGTYVIRMNADTGRIFGVNDISVAEASTVAPKPRLSSQDAIARAREYVRLLHGGDRNLTLLNTSRAYSVDEDPTQVVNFQESLPGKRQRTLTITIDIYNGSLKTLWYVPSV